MDDTRFDMFIRQLTQRRPRREVVRRLLTALGLGGAATLAQRDLTAAIKNKKKKKKNRPCRQGKKRCGLRCRDLRRDRNHCGACHRGCPRGTRCQRGACAERNTSTSSPIARCTPTVGPADDLQQAIDNAPAGSTLCLDTGTYPVAEPLLIAKPLTLMGQGAAATILHGDGSDRVLHLLGDPAAAVDIAVHLERLTITGGAADLGGGIRAEYIDLALTECVVAANTATQGGGIHSAKDGKLGTLTMTGCTISNNTALDPDHPGQANGGGVFTGPHVSLAMSGCTVLGNDAAGAGGGIFARDDIHGDQHTMTVTLSACTVSANDAIDGAGIGTERSHLNLLDSTISDNDAVDRGGGIIHTTGSDPAYTATISNTTITGNTADRGGGVFYSNGNAASEMELIASSVTDNTATTAGSDILSDDVADTLTLINSTVDTCEPAAACSA